MVSYGHSGFAPNNPPGPLIAIGKLRHFFDSVLPVIADHWLRHSIAMTYLDSMYDSAADLDDMGCGPVAFAAICGIPSTEIPAYFPGFPGRAWTNRLQMERAIEGFGWNFAKATNTWPKVGFCFIHWCGPWTDRGYAHGVLERTHWVAVIGDYVFDVNWRAWLPKENWEDVVVPELLRTHRSAHGWIPLTAYELSVNREGQAA